MRNLLILAFLVVSCSSQNKEIVNSKWIYNYGHCQDYFAFKEGNRYVSFSCETGDTIFGHYSILKDVILINQSYGSFDKEFDENSRHSLGQAEYKLVLKKNNQLGYLENWDEINNDWKENYFYQKIKE
jgi:hypothetical protein